MQVVLPRCCAWSFLVLLAMGGCSAPAVLPEPCPEGSRPLAEDGRCEPIPRVCAAGSAELVPGAECAPLGWTGCPVGFEAAASGWGCEPILPGTACPAGTMPVIGSRTCQPVGWTSCGEGFIPDLSGWGCSPVLPPGPCFGATLELLGSTSCQPLGECGAAFPPAAATLFVDDSYSAGQLDAQHFKTIGAALNAAPSGASVAVESGTYFEGLVFHRPVKLIGRCAAQVVLSGTASQPGLDASGVKGVEVEGLTVTGFDLGAYVDGAGSLELRGCRVEANGRTGVQAMGAGTVARLVSTVVRGTLPDGSGRFGLGVAARGGARLELTRSAVVDNGEMGVFVTDPATGAVVSKSLVRGTRSRGDGRFGWGLAAQSGAQLQVQGSAVSGNRTAGLLVGASSKAVLTQSHIGDTLPGADNAGSVQASNLAVMPGGTLEMAQGGLVGGICQLEASSVAGSTAKVTLSEVTMRGAIDHPLSEALRVHGGSVLSATGCAVIDNHGAGVHVYSGSSAELLDVLVQGTLVTADAASGFGLMVSASTVSGARLAVIGNAGAGVALRHRASASFQRALISETRAAPVVVGGDYGIGLFVDSQAQLELTDGVVAGNIAAGVLVAQEASSARLTGTLVRGTLLDSTGNGQGVVAQEGARVHLEGVGIVENLSAGLQVNDPGSCISAVNVLVASTLPGLDGKRGRGATVQSGACLELTHSALIDNRQVGIFAWAAETRVRLTSSLIASTAADPDGRFGNGIEVLERARADLRDSLLLHHPGIALVVANAAATVGGGKLESNQVALHAQDGSEIREVEAIAEPVGATEVLVTSSTAFEGNTLRVGSGKVVLPER